MEKFLKYSEYQSKKTFFLVLQGKFNSLLFFYLMVFLVLIHFLETDFRAILKLI